MVASDEHNEARMLELKGHPFYLATLFIPQASSSFEKPHPLIVALLTAMEQHNRIVAAEVPTNVVGMPK
jgi:CTP synthase (UTP-ammonia lyase)